MGTSKEHSQSRVRNDPLASLKKKKECRKPQNKLEKNASNTRPATSGTKKRIFPAVKQAWSEHSLPQENGNSKESNVRVAIRIRPPIAREMADYKKSVYVVGDKISLRPPPCAPVFTPHKNQRGNTSEHSFSFDYVAVEESTQQDVYENTAKPLVEHFLKGFNCALIAYGQTGTGKTYTMHGSTMDSASRGCIPLLLNEIFDQKSIASWSQKDDESEMEQKYYFRCSFVHIYQEKINDLFKAGNNDLKLMITSSGQVLLPGVSWVNLDSADQALKEFKRGSKHRFISKTSANDVSSRSHAIFILEMECRSRKGTDIHVKNSRFYFADLAGSERQDSSKANDIQVKEATFINKSLSTLGSVVTALTTCSQHVPYRDSKLTFLLKDALGGNARCCLIACISPADSSREESLATLRFAHRTKWLSNTAEANLAIETDSLQLQAENSRLKGEIVDLRAKLDSGPPPTPHRSRDGSASVRRPFLSSSKISKVTKEAPKRSDHLSRVCSNIPRFLDPNDSSPLSARGINRLLSSIRILQSVELSCKGSMSHRGRRVQDKDKSSILNSMIDLYNDLVFQRERADINESYRALYSLSMQEIEGLRDDNSRQDSEISEYEYRLQKLERELSFANKQLESYERRRCEDDARRLNADSVIMNLKYENLVVEDALEYVVSDFNDLMWRHSMKDIYSVAKKSNAKIADLGWAVVRKKKHHSMSLARSLSNKIKGDGEIREGSCEPPIPETHHHRDFNDDHHEGAVNDDSIALCDTIEDTRNSQGASILGDQEDTRAVPSPDRVSQPSSSEAVNDADILYGSPSSQSYDDQRQATPSKDKRSPLKIINPNNGY